MAGVEFEPLELIVLFHVRADKKRYSAWCRLKEIGPFLVQAFPITIIEIGTTVDLLGMHEAKAQSITGVFLNFNDARDAVRAWCWKFAACNASNRY